jgi:hypothetical protein
MKRLPLALSAPRVNGTLSWDRRLVHATAALGFLSVLAFAQSGLAQTTPPLNFGNNYFVTGDYVVAGVGLRGLGVNGYATGTINLPDANSVPSAGVPAGADVVAAFLYWETVESSQTTFAGQQGYFRGYPITGVILGNPNAPVSWSSGGCSGNSQGSKTMRTYRANVLSLLPVDSNGNLQPNNSYPVSLRDSGSNGGGAPLTLGASLVIVYRVLDPNVPLNAVIFYDGAFAPANGSSTMTQTMQGFYQAAANPVSKFTEIVGNGQPNKYENVYLGNDPSIYSNDVSLPSLYGNGTLPPFPGVYNQNTISLTAGGGSWDNPTWIVNNYGAAVQANDSSETTFVVPSSSNSGCVSWGAVILSTTVQNSDNDGILDVWKANQGYCDASIYEGKCSTTDPSWVALPGATKGKKDLFVQMDYMCSTVNPDGACPNGTSELPSQQALTMLTNAFAPKGINLHLFPTYAIQEQTCHDDLTASPPVVCPAPNVPGVVGWKAGFSFLKNQPLNINPATGSTYTETECQQNPTTCVRRFQHGRKDSYHYALFGHALGTPNWTLLSKTLESAVASGNTVMFTTSIPTGLVALDTVDGNGRVTVSGAISNLSLNGTYIVQSTPSPTSFTIQIANATNATYTLSTDPSLSVGSGQIRSGSGMSDIGGEDSLITLGLWGADGQTMNVQAGTFMHELGHSLGLTHGGFYYETPGTYIATGEPNCKPNFQSVMNYLFQVDLLDNGTLDYSEQKLSTLNENGLPPASGGVSTTDGSALAYLTTQWYALSPPGGVGSSATHHCDGTPLAPLTDPDPTMYRVGGTANPISPAWSNGQDINFNGNTDVSLQGYNDWANIDLRQIGATGSLSTESPGQFNGGQFNGGQFNGGQFNGGQFNGGQFNGGQFNAGQFNGGQFNGGQFNGGQFNGGQFNGGLGDFTHEAATSVTRPPRNLTAATTPPPRYIQLNWQPPTFGQISSYNIYKATNGTPVPNTTPPTPYATVSGSTTTFTDQNVSCGPTYTYFVTAVIMVGNPPTPQESVGSNQVSQTDCAPPYTFTGFYSPLTMADPPNTGSFSGTFNAGKSVTAKWTLQDSSGNLVTTLNVNTLYVTGSYAPSASGPACSTTQAPLISSYNGALPPNVSALYSPTSGAKGNSTFRFSTNQFVFNWDTTGFPTGCWVMELDLDSGQVERTSLRLK